MAALSVLLRLDLAPEIDAASAKQRLAGVGLAEGLVTKVNVVEGDEDGPYLNVTYSSASLQALWTLLRAELSGVGGRQPLLGCAIVVCTGQFGWDDYLLLHHFKDSEPLGDLVVGAEPPVPADSPSSSLENTLG